MLYKFKLFVLRTVTWSSNCLLKIIRYLKPYNCVQANDYWVIPANFTYGLSQRSSKLYSNFHYLLIYHHHLHHVTLPAWISLTLSRQPSLLSIAPGRSSKLNPVVIYEGLYFDLAQGQMNGAPNETRTHSCRFASLTC